MLPPFPLCRFIERCAFGWTSARPQTGLEFREVIYKRHDFESTQLPIQRYFSESSGRFLDFGSVSLPASARYVTIKPLSLSLSLPHHTVSVTVTPRRSTLTRYPANGTETGGRYLREGAARPHPTHPSLRSQNWPSSRRFRFSEFYSAQGLAEDTKKSDMPGLVFSEIVTL
jgi:hypothetical protein